MPPHPICVLTFKRIHLLAARVARAFAAIAGLTPARADLMITLLHRPLRQREIVEALGVSEPVISRMLKALEGLGLIERQRSEHDRRVRVVALTQAGRAALNVLFDGNMGDTGEEAVQSGADSTFLMRCGAELAAGGVLLKMPWGDVGALVRPIQRRVWTSNPWDFLDATIPIADLTPPTGRRCRRPTSSLD